MSHDAETTPDTDLRSPVACPPLALAGVAVVVALAALARLLEQTVPAAAKGTAFAGVAAAIEFPVYAIVLGLLGNVVLTRLGCATGWPAASGPSSSSRPVSSCSARRSTSR